jgi:hypothetical protein
VQIIDVSKSRPSLRRIVGHEATMNDMGCSGSMIQGWGRNALIRRITQTHIHVITQCCSATFGQRSQAVR